MYIPATEYWGIIANWVSSFDKKVNKSFDNEQLRKINKKLDIFCITSCFFIASNSFSDNEENISLAKKEFLNNIDFKLSSKELLTALNIISQTAPSLVSEIKIKNQKKMLEVENEEKRFSRDNEPAEKRDLGDMAEREPGMARELKHFQVSKLRSLRIETIPAKLVERAENLQNNELGAQ